MMSLKGWGSYLSKKAQGFANHIKESHLDTEYALLVEFLCNPNETYVGGIHFFRSDKEGQLASGGLTNSHWEEYQEIEPRDRLGGYELVLAMLNNDWSKE